MLVCAMYVWWHLRSGWIPIDDGPVAQSAERVLHGELPHRDFDELYTGGLAFVNALGFRILGTNLWTLRIVLFAAFVAWLPAVFYIASRFVRPVAAACVGVLAVVWSLPNYPTAMASWYNLFLATAGIAVLLRWLEDPRRRWLVLAGVLGGLSILVKIIGLYYVAGMLLFLVYRAQATSFDTESAHGPRGRGYAAFVTGALVLFIGALFGLVRSHLQFSEVVQFVLPSTLVSLLLVRNEWTMTGSGRERAAMLARAIFPFLLGVALPVAAFIVVYASAGAVNELLYGVFIAPQKRLGLVAVQAPALWTMLTLVPFAAFVALVYRKRGVLSRRETILAVAVLLLVLRASGGSGALYRSVWFSARTLLPVLAIAGVAALARRRQAGTSMLLDAQTMLVLAVTCVCSLAQYPYSTSLYFCYVAPLIVLLLVALYRHAPLPHRVAPALLIGFFTAFAILRTNATRLASMGAWYQPPPPLERLSMDRGGVDVPVPDARNYEALVAKLRARAQGPYIWASPDAPEVYFLSGLKNPTRTLFEVFDAHPRSPDRVMRNLESHRVNVVVLGTPSFSPPISSDMYARLFARYPHEEYVGTYLMRWRD
jgi:hypothetical protein